MQDGMPSYPGVSLRVYEQDRIGVLELARPNKSNAFNNSMWSDFTKAMQWLDECSSINVVIIQGQGQNFCGGIDLETLGSVTNLMNAKDPARGSAKFRQKILNMQDSFNAIEACACIGGGLDLIAACDMRICSADATFCLKEVDLALAADLGSLQRLPKLIGYGRTLGLALTAGPLSAIEAQQVGLVSEVCASKTDLQIRARKLAGQIAAKSPMAVIGIKRVMLHARDAKVSEGLEYVATFNGSQALSHDMKETFEALRTKRRPVYSKL